jgi:hypothetical protein
MTQIFLSMVYTFLVVSYLASAGTEGLASLFRWRARMLFRTVQTMLDDRKTGLARAVYAQPIVHPPAAGETLGQGSLLGIGSNLPSYIDDKNFAIALSHILGFDDPDMFRGKSPDEVQRLVADIPALRDAPSLQTLLRNIINRTQGDMENIREALAVWFENSNARLVGAYKRRVMLSNFLLGLAMAVIFNINPLSPLVTLAAHDPAPVPQAPMAQSPMSTPPATVPPNAPTGIPTTTSATSSIPVVTPSAASGGGPPAAFQAVSRVFGWLLAALSTLLGAPFWFDLLSRIGSVKAAGPAPKTAPAPATAPSGSPASSTSGTS